MFALYLPDPAAIEAAAARARANLPMATRRLDEAVTILADLEHAVCLNQDGSWTYHNPRDTTYTVSPGHCTCPDFVHHLGPATPYYCKHLLAYYGWRRCIIEALKCFANPDDICTVCLSSQGEIVPATPADFALASHYLATGRPYRPASPPWNGEGPGVGCLEDPPDPPEWQPSPITRLWLATGEIVPPVPA